MAEKLSPMMRQYKHIKKEHPDCVVFFRMGDFYEMFFEDAKEASPILDIVLTSRAGCPMCGVPYHALDLYLDKMVAAGKKVAICEQVEDPKKATGVVKRAVVRVVTPGTVISSSSLVEKSNNYIGAACLTDSVYGLSYLDVTTGEFKVIEFSSEREFLNELMRVPPVECVLPQSLMREGAIRSQLDGYVRTFFAESEDWNFEFDSCFALLTDHFGTHSLDGFGLVGMRAGICSAGALLNYVEDKLNQELAHVQSIVPYSTSEFMVIDPISLRNLEILQSTRYGGREGTLLEVLDKTVTPMGGRMLASLLRQPLLKVEPIRRRQECVAEIYERQDALRGLQENLRRVRDLERLITRISTGFAGPRDVVALKTSLMAVPRVAGELEGFSSPLLVETRGKLVPLDRVVELIEKAIVQEPPATMRDGGVFKRGYDADLDELKSISSDGKSWIASFQERERKRTGIKSMKVGFNKVFGYYLEVTHKHRDLVPEDYIRKQTLVNAERYITPELKEYETKVLNAEERIAEIEAELFRKLRREIAKDTAAIQEIARAVAFVDVVASFAAAALEYNYVRPDVDDSDVIHIAAGRHPVIERAMTGERFVPNDVLLDGSDNQLLIITGPNMAGKSTYIRQNALLVLMAQIGSFIPADSARIGIVDRVFTRVGASDELIRGQSTFMVEMNETANILNNATQRSLIILDEIGRGTSTYDGISIAWAVAEYLSTHAEKRARTLFATHYHELTRLEDVFPGIRNYNVAVREWNDEIVFIRRIMPGGTDRSYGIHVADLAGLPSEVIERAKAILEHLEENSTKEHLADKARGIGKVKHPRQMFLFADKPHPVVEELKGLDIDKLSPIEALMKLKEMKEKAEE